MKAQKECEEVKLQGWEELKKTPVDTIYCGPKSKSYLKLLMRQTTLKNSF